MSIYIFRTSIYQILFLSLLASLSACSVVGIATTEEAPYTTLRTVGDFEIRRYPTVIVAQVTSSTNWEESQSESFQVLFNYISGNNTSQQDISMTAPVLLKELNIENTSSTKISMTSPVLLSENSNGSQMSFVLPIEYTLKTAPQPADERVKIIALKSGEKLVYRFSGVLNEESITIAEKKLFDFAKERDIQIDKSSIQSAGYNPPWTIPWFRRNEILVDLI